MGESRRAWPGEEDGWWRIVVPLRKRGGAARSTRSTHPAHEEECRHGAGEDADRLDPVIHHVIAAGRSREVGLRARGGEHRVGGEVWGEGGA